MRRHWTRWLIATVLVTISAASSRAQPSSGDEPAPQPPPSDDDTQRRLPPPPPPPSPNTASPPAQEPAQEPSPAPASDSADNLAAESPEGEPEPDDNPQAYQPPPKPSSTLEVYGFAMLDLGFDFGQIGNPDWFDVLRPTMLPAFKNEYGKGPRWFEGVRQSRFGASWKLPTDYGDIETKFEFELFGVGVDAGQTTFRLRHAYGKWKGLRAGQTWSPFMDPDVFPDSIEYWGPNGMVFFRNVQLAYSFYEHKGSDITLAIERPGASADGEAIADRFDLSNVVPRFPVPDISADAKLATSWGYLRLAGIVRYMRWDDLSPTPVVQGSVWGAGVNASANVKLGPALLKLEGTYGEAIENYMNDAGPDVGPKLDSATSVKGVGLPVVGLLAFVDVKWCEYLTSTAGYSFVWIDNSSDQLPDAFHIGHYALGNLLIHPLKQLYFGPEFQFGRRENNSDGFSANDYRLQFSVKYSFEQKLGAR